ncbi:MAG: AsmA family protein, partial [Myxococcaceae bacterium]
MAGARRPWLRRWALRLGLLAVVLFALVVALLIGARLYLSTPGGQAKVLALALDPANEALEGRIEVGEVELAGLRVVLRNLKLYDPEGELVAEIERVELTPRFAALAERRIEVHEAELTRPRLYLVQDSRGLNLTRAVQPKKRGGPPSGKPPSLVLAAGRLTLSGGYLSFAQRPPEGPERRYALEDVAGKGGARYVARSRALESEVEMTGRATAPAQAPLTLEGTLHGEGGSLFGQASLSLGKAKLVARASREGT